MTATYTPVRFLRRPLLELSPYWGNADLKGLPPVTSVNAQIDPLRSDGAFLVVALKSAGMEVTRKEYTGVTREFFGTATVAEKAKDAQRFAG